MHGNQNDAYRHLLLHVFISSERKYVKFLKGPLSRNRFSVKLPNAFSHGGDDDIDDIIIMIFACYREAKNYCMHEI